MVESYRNYFCVVPLHVRGTLLVSARSRSMTPLRISVVPKLQTLVPHSCHTTKDTTIQGESFGSIHIILRTIYPYCVAPAGLRMTDSSEYLGKLKLACHACERYGRVSITSFVLQHSSQCLPCSSLSPVCFLLSSIEPWVSLKADQKKHRRKIGRS